MQWRVEPQVEPSAELQQLASRLKLHPVIVQLLAQRGMQEQKTVEEFLQPSLAELPSPLEMGGMKEAVLLAGRAVLAGEPILIWGDYDVDGTTGTALLVSFFRELGVTVKYIIPNRITHGYGLHVDLLRSLAPANLDHKTLLITVDCGISANDEILAAQKMGFQVLVTDHHEPPEGFFAADAILNPKQLVCTFPTEELAGVGVAFYLACGLRQYLREKGFFNAERSEPDVRDLLDLVALGTIADMVPLRKVNRVLVKEGMLRIEQQKRAGLRAMLEVAGLLNSQKKTISAISSGDIGFLLAPMINAAGRLAEADLAVQLLLSQDVNQAMDLAKELLTLNNERKNIGQDVYARAVILQEQKAEKCNCLILKGDFHHGVIGIVASRMVEKFHLPVIIFGQEKDSQDKMVFKGSGRSVPGVNLHVVLEGCSDTMIRYGGHAMAAGMSVSEEFFDLFSRKVNEEVGRQLKDVSPVVTLTIDLEAEIDEIFSADCSRQMQLLEPFGPGNRSPVFYTRRPQLVETRVIGAEGAHLKVSFQGNNSIQKGVGFGLGSYLPNLRQDNNPAIAYAPMANRYRGIHTWEVKVVGLQFPQNQDIQKVSI
ncbi:MAG: single-stranded-DNA-specific exonuclease RecJ [Proteobacteria bacterium]|nr:single-stranded-DNA-specific exonuclease RecJ [Pseudomonadota bacterium]MBU1986558.1 single-stranded-DNA-specific exonuclease RecJ [Pseudomonadota bacterium]